jgi:TRAP-type C4-dicarboxylate transport system substrate-binding protein
VLSDRHVVVGFLVAVVALSACGGPGPGDDKAGGGAPPGPVLLRMASNPSSLTNTPAVADFVQRVADLSRGAIRIAVINQWGSFAVDAEVQEVHAVSSGDMDLGWAGSRVFDSLGVSDLQALTAPMLIDSYPLENAVLNSAIPNQMLAALTRVGVTGLGILGDGLRRPASVRRPLLAPADWRGIGFGTYRSVGQQQAIRALGATPLADSGPLRTRALDTGEIQAFEMDIRRYDLLGLAAEARYVTANVSLWPQFDVVFANPHRLASLTDQQRSWLKQAAADASAHSVALSRDTAKNVDDVCAQGARFAFASAGDLTALQQAMSAVYQGIETDPTTRAFVQQMQDLKRSTPSRAGLPIPTTCRVSG